MEDHQLLLTYLLLVASSWRGPLALAFLNLKKAYYWLLRVTLWRMLAEGLEVPEDVSMGIKALYFQTWSVVQA